MRSMAYRPAVVAGQGKPTGSEQERAAVVIERVPGIAAFHSNECENMISSFHPPRAAASPAEQTKLRTKLFAAQGRRAPLQAAWPFRKGLLSSPFKVLSGAMRA